MRFLCLFSAFHEEMNTESHFLLMMRCVTVCIRGRMLKFIGNFLKNRNVRKFRTNYSLSTTKFVMNELPQRSVLSPTLFNVLLHDLGHKT